MDGGHSYRCEANSLDLSRKGIQIELPSPVLKGQHLKLTIQALGVQIDAKVVHVISRGTRWICGIQFDHPLD